MSGEPARSVPGGPSSCLRGQSPGLRAQIACLLEVTARKPGNVHRLADLGDLQFVDFLMSALAIGEPLDRAAEVGIGQTVFRAIEATRRVVRTNTNLGIALLLAPLAVVPEHTDLAQGLEKALSATTLDDARWAYRAIRLAQPGGLGNVAAQDISAEPTVTLRAAMALAAERDLIARQYANGFRDVLDLAVPNLRQCLTAGTPLESAIVVCYLTTLARHPDSLLARKHGAALAQAVSDRAALVLERGWPDQIALRRECDAFDTWLRQASSPLNPGTTADIVTAALYVALRDGTIDVPFSSDFGSLSDAQRLIT
jgi:triphosphoribosyl-dephospho-CoA synthase